MARNQTASRGESVIAGSKLVVAGYYYCGNLGDDALLYGFLTSLGDAPAQITVLAGNPVQCTRELNVRAVDRRNFSEIKKELESADALVFAGGSILQDVTSVFSMGYYTKLIKLAKSLDKKVIMLAQGIGPVNSMFGKNMARTALKTADVLTVREPQSIQVMRGLGVNRPVEVTADFAWLVQPSESGSDFQLGTMKTVGICARPWKNDKKIIAAFGDFAQILFRNQYVPVLIEMDKSMDTAMLDSIAKLHGGRCPDMRNIPGPGNLAARLRRMHAVVSMRLHGGIMAAAGGVPPLMIAYDPKVTAFCNLLELPAPVSLENLTGDKLWQAFMAFERDRDRILALIELKKDEQTSLALKNVNILQQALPGLAGAPN
ncbi:MAG: polysaccharide pyruvyl transferase CsaB [Fimbriimonadales bacterium]